MGKGTYGDVCRCLDLRSGREFAMKKQSNMGPRKGNYFAKFDPRRQHCDSLNVHQASVKSNREANIMRLLKHRNIVRYLCQVNLCGDFPT